MRFFLRPLLAAIGLLCLLNLAYAQFWDQGFEQNLTRTPYNQITDGTDGDPITLTFPCVFDPSEEVTINGCMSDPRSEALTEFGPDSNAYWIGNFNQPRFWLLDMNNEAPGFRIEEPPFLVSHPLVDCNSGPGHLSLPRSEPGSGIMGFTILKDEPQGEDFFRVSLVLNLTSTNPCGAGALPFISFGASNIRGNGGVIGRLNSSTAPSRTRFTIQMWQFIAPSCADEELCPPCTGGDCDVLFPGQETGGAAASRVFAVASWGSPAIPRMLTINLFHWNFEDSWPPPDLPSHRNWNWPILEHYLQPGADLGFFDAEDVELWCPGVEVPLLDVIGEDVEYTLDWQELFQCASDIGLFDEPMDAYSEIPIISLAWANEATGEGGGIWTSYHAMEMLDSLGNDTFGDDDDENEDDDEDDDDDD